MFMNNRFAGLAVIAAIMIVSGCSTQNTTQESSQGDFELLVSDAPAAIDDFEYLNTTFSTARVFVQNGSNSTFEEIDIQDRTVDLTTVKGAKAESLVNTTLEPGNYSKIELEVSNIEASVNGSDTDVKLPSEKLQITKPFTVSENTTTSFVFDIQVVLRGNDSNNQGYILKPVISESGVAGKDVEVERKGGQPEDTGKQDSGEQTSGNQTRGAPEDTPAP